MGATTGMGFVGVRTEDMEEVCSNLITQAGNIENFIDELEALKQELPNYWEGSDLETLIIEFQTFRNKLSEIPEIVTSIARWGDTTTDAYSDSSVSTSMKVSEIFNY